MAAFHATNRRGAAATARGNRSIMQTLENVVEEEELRYESQRLVVADLRAEIRELQQWKDQTLAKLGDWQASRTRTERNFVKVRQRQTKRATHLNAWQRDLMAREDLEAQIKKMTAAHESLLEEVQMATVYGEEAEERLQLVQRGLRDTKGTMDDTEEKLAQLVWALWRVVMAEADQAKKDDAKKDTRGSPARASATAAAGGGEQSGSSREAFQLRLRQLSLAHDPLTAVQLVGDEMVGGIDKLLVRQRKRAAKAEKMMLRQAAGIQASDDAVTKASEDRAELQRVLVEEQKRKAALEEELAAFKGGALGELVQRVEQSELAYKQIWRMLQVSAGVVAVDLPCGCPVVQLASTLHLADHQTTFSLLTRSLTRSLD